MKMGGDEYLSVRDIMARWSCGRSFVYTAIQEMKDNGYLQRQHAGREQRVSVRSVLEYESRHRDPPPDRVMPPVRRSAAPARRRETAPSVGREVRQQPAGLTLTAHELHLLSDAMTLYIANFRRPPLPVNDPSRQLLAKLIEFHEALLNETRVEVEVRRAHAQTARRSEDPES